MEMDGWLPESWAKEFGKGSQPKSDFRQYPDKSELVSVFNDSVARVKQHMVGLTEDRLVSPLPDQRFLKWLPTLGDAICQVLVAHSAYHVGQIVAWRNAAGKLAIGRAFL